MSIPQIHAKISHSLSPPGALAVPFCPLRSCRAPPRASVSDTQWWRLLCFLRWDVAVPSSFQDTFQVGHGPLNQLPQPRARPEVPIPPQL